MMGPETDKIKPNMNKSTTS
jgi:hypothetical protein